LNELKKEINIIIKNLKPLIYKKIFKGTYKREKTYKSPKRRLKKKKEYK